ncbi:MAG: hypothetical protein ACFE85_03400 [Candidatus Hodarchaeota archaeon]
MTRNEEFIQKVYEIVTELKVPLIDEIIHERAKFNGNKAITLIRFVYEKDEAVIRGFLGLAAYFHTIIIKDKNKFYIPNGKQLYTLEGA